MITEELYQNYLAALLRGDYRKCEGIVKNFLDQEIGLVVLYTDLFQRSLYEVGELWERNRITVAVEHLATAISERLLAIVYPGVLSRSTGGGTVRKAVISCSVNEYHQVGARMVSDLMDLNGWNVHFLGANTPVEDLLEMIQSNRPDLLGLSLSIYFNLTNLHRVIQAVRLDYPQLDIIVGGQAFRHGGVDYLKKYPRVAYIPTLEELKRI